MGRPGSVQLARVFGIRIGADRSWFLLLLAGIYVFREWVDDQTAGSDVVVLVAALALTFLAFGSVVVHELGHVLAARRYGVGVSGIRLWVLGGLAQLSEEAPTPGIEFRVTAAGPLGTLLVVLMSAGAGLLLAGPAEFVAALTFDHGGSLPVGTAIASTLTLVELAALASTLIPVYPLDGGRIAIAAAWRLTGDRRQAMRVGSLVGRGFGVVLILGGLLEAAALAHIVFGLYLAVVGVWIATDAHRGGVHSTAMQRWEEVTERLEGVTVGDIMSECYRIPAETPARRAYEEFFRDTPGLVLYPVVEPDGSYLGCAWGEPIR